MTDPTPHRAPGGGRPPLQRVPPHDDATEADLLGAAMLTDAAARIVATIGPDPFYRSQHQVIADTITRLVQRGHPCDPGTVAAHVTKAGQVDAIGGTATLITLQANCPATASAAHWADLIQEHHRRRQVLNGAAELVEAVYQGLPTAGLIAQLHQQAVVDQLGQASTWEPVNLAAVLAGDAPQLTPTIWSRSDGHFLLYPGKIHSINAEPEAGKSWCMQHASAQQIQAGAHVLYVDFEADAKDVTGRLLELGCTPTQILEYFHYIRPDDPIDAQALLKVAAACETWQPTLAILDGVTEAMVGAGWSIKDNDDIARFFAAMPRPVARTGAAVVLIDHVVKDAEQQGRWGIGGAHKLAGIDGATYKLEALTPFSKDNPGSSRLICQKDRHGQIRPNCKDQKLAAVIHFKPLPGGYGIDITVDPYGDNDTREAFRPTHLMERISQSLAHGPALTTNQLRAAVRGKAENVSLALRYLVTDGYVQAARQGQATYHSNIRPYPDPEPEDTKTDETF